MESRLNALATIELDKAAHTRWDVIVVGAGPAGSVAAREVARRGAITLLVDRQTFPRDKVCGGCLNGQAVSLLRQLELESAIAPDVAAPISRIELRCTGRRAPIPLPGGVAIRRSQFDAVLVRSAIASGVAFLPGVIARVGSVNANGSDSRREVEFTQSGIPSSSSSHDAPARTQRDIAVVASARVVLVADGLGHPSLRRHDELTDKTSPRTHVGLGAILPDAPGEFAAETIHMAVAPGGYVGAVRLADGSLNVAAAVSPAALRAAGGTAEAVNAILAGCGWPAVEADGTWHGTTSLTRQLDRPALERVLVLGDAAGYVEPFTGEGMTWALLSAVAVAPWVERGLRCWDRSIEDGWCRDQHQRLVAGQRVCRWITSALRSPRLVRGAVTLLSHYPGLARVVTRRLNASRACSPLTGVGVLK
jgi:flavin-dependent dehydrogenase